MKVSFVFMLLFLLSGCGFTEEYTRHIVPGPVQIFENEDSIFTFLQFDQVFSPVKKPRHWDHPSGRKLGARQWLFILPKNGDAATVKQFYSTERGGVGYGLTFHPNLSQIFWYQDHWYAWKGELYDVERSIFRFNKDLVRFELLDELGENEELIKRLIGFEKDQESYHALMSYIEKSEVASVFEDSICSTKRMSETFQVTVASSKGAYRVSLVLEEGDNPTVVELAIERGLETVTSIEIDRLPHSPVGKEKPWHKRNPFK